MFVYDEKSSKAIYYSALSTNYKQNQKDGLKIYHVDLGSDLNKGYLSTDGTSNLNVTKVTDCKFKDYTLLRIKNGKVDKYIEDEAGFQKELAVTTK